MKRFIQDPVRAFLSIIGIAFVMFLITLSSCESRSERNFKQAQESKQAIEVVNHNAKAIIIETLYDEILYSGIWKISIDSSEYIVVANGNGIAIMKHK